MHSNRTQHSSAARRLLHRAALFALAAVAACTDAPNAVTIPADAVSLARAPSVPNNTLNVGISGLPAGTLAGVRVTGPNGFVRTVDVTTSLTGLADGSYLVSASSKSVGSDTYAPSPSSQSLSLRRSKTGNASITYTKVATTGSLALTITIPEVTPAPVTVTGPNAFSQSVASSQTLSGLAPGTYTIAAPNFTSPSGVSYASSAASQAVSVTVGNTVAAGVTYTATNVPPTTGFNMRVLGAYVVQSVQTLSNSVALVANRDGVLRVFAVASEANTVQATVRARVYNNGLLVATYTMNAPTTSVPTVLSEAPATTSWNVKLPGSLIQPGLSILADVDPDGTVSESDEGDNSYPSSGTPLPLVVRTVPSLAVRYVPVVASGLQGNITSSNADSMLTATRDIFPLQSVSWSIRAPYTTSNALVSDGTGWSAVLSEVEALRRAEGATQHHYGVVKVNYSSGVAGMGYIGLPSSIGWDYMSSGIETMAHEFGHNWGRYHAPCGGPGGPDANFPYAGGISGVYGWNVRRNSFIDRSTADLMGYCRPRWVSDYTYNAVFNYRGYSTSAMVAASSEPGLLVWGRISASGDITLEPSLRVNAPRSLPQRPGAYTLEATDASDAPLVSFSFDADEVGDGAPGERHFAFVIPMNEGAYARLQRVRVEGNARTAERQSRLPGAALQALADRASLGRAAAGRGRLRWEGGSDGAPMVLVRDPQTGEVLSFARGGDVTLSTSRTELDLVVSDGVRSATRRVRMQ